MSILNGSRIQNVSTAPRKQPFTATATSTLIADIIGSSDLLVDATSNATIAPYRNPFTNGAVEAAVVVNGGLSRLMRDADNNWQLVAVPRPALSGAREVVALVAPNGTVWIFVASARGTHFLELKENGFELHAGYTDLFLDHIGVAYAAPTPLRWPIFYGFERSGTLVILNYLNQNPFDKHLIAKLDFASNQGVLGLANSGLARIAGAIHGEFSWYELTLPHGIRGPVRRDDWPRVAKVIGSYQEDYNQIAFIYISTDGNVCVARQLGAHPVCERLASVQATDGRVVIDEKGQMTLYLIGDDERLSLVHQVGWNTDRSPIWSSAYTEQNRARVPLLLGLASEVTGVAVDGYPQATPAVLVLGASTPSNHTVSLLGQDPTTDEWSRQNIALTTTQLYKVSRFVTRVSLRDGDGLPLDHYTATLSAESATEVEVAGKRYALSPRHEATMLQTDVSGSLSIATAATGLTATPLTLAVDGLPVGLTLKPDAHIQAYLAGTGTLPLRPTFDAETLRNAKVGDRSLVPDWNAISPQDAVTMMQGAIALGDPNLPRPSCAGMVLQKYDKSRPAFRMLATKEELTSELTELRAHPNYGGIWDDAADFAGDVWEGIKSGAVEVIGEVNNFVDNAVHFVIQVGEAFIELSQIAIRSVADAFNVVAGVFNELAANVKDVVGWLQTALSFADVWETKKALQSGFERIGPILATQIDAMTSTFVNTFFADATSYVQQGFAFAEAQLGVNSIGALDAQRGQPAFLVRAGKSIVGLAELIETQASAIANWLWDKLLGQWLDELNKLLPSLNFPSLEIFNQSMDELITAFATIGDDAAKVFEKLVDWFVATVSGRDVDTATALRDTALSQLFTALEAMSVDSIALLRAIANQLIALAKNMASSIPAFLGATIGLGAIDTVYDWIQEMIGVPHAERTELTLGDLICLLAAFPATYGYKLLMGSASAAPFPGGVLPAPSPTGDEESDNEKGKTYVRTSALIAGVAALMGFFADIVPPTNSVITVTRDDVSSEPVSQFLAFAAALTGWISNFLFWPSEHHIFGEEFARADTAEKAAFGNWVMGNISPMVDLGFCAFSLWKTGKRNTWVKRADAPLGIGVDTLFGLVSLVLGLVESISGREKWGEVTSNILSPLPALAQPLRAKPVTLPVAIKLLVDMFGGVGGAFCRLAFVEDLEPEPASRPLSPARTLDATVA